MALSVSWLGHLPPRSSTRNLAWPCSAQLSTLQYKALYSSAQLGPAQPYHSLPSPALAIIFSSL